MKKCLLVAAVFFALFANNAQAGRRCGGGRGSGGSCGGAGCSGAVYGGNTVYNSSCSNSGVGMVFSDGTTTYYYAQPIQVVPTYGLPTTNPINNPPTQTYPPGTYWKADERGILRPFTPNNQKDTTGN